ncbi:MAG: hypothetical protein Q9227_008085 [Pyrenula ochraceoflavens]
MASLFRGKQVGIQNDLSTGIAPDLFASDEFARYGVNSQISTLAYEPIQSLLAVGTSESKYGGGQVYVFGQKRVCAVYKTPRKASIKFLQFCADKLLCVDSKNDLSDILAYDLDREAVTNFKIPNCWREMNPRARIAPVVSMQFHPKDIGTMLIGYSEGAVIFSFKQNKPTKYFHYEVPRGAPGGDSDPSTLHEVRRPRLTHAIWHPTATFILTAHDDSSLVFWDPKDGRVLEARTIQDPDVNIPGAGSRSPGNAPGTFSVKEPYFRIAWCSKENPDDTGLLIAGGTPTTSPTRGLTFLDLGLTPVYQTSSWQILSSHFQSPKRQHVLPTPPNAEVVEFLPIPRPSPHYAGSHDPIAVICLLGSGELVTLSFPSGHPITPTNQLPLSLTYVHPFVTKTALSCIDRTRWLGFRENRQHGPLFVQGGGEGIKPMKRFERRNVVQMAQADGVVRVWDAGNGDSVENESVLQVDVARAVGRFDNIEITQMSLSGAAGELSIGLRSGEVAIFRWNQNRSPRDSPPGPNEGPGQLTNIMHRADPGLKEGFLPMTLLNEQQGPVSAIKHSDIGFICIGFEAGSIAMIDMRGPAIIYTTHLSEFIQKSRRGSIRRSNSQAGEKAEWPTCIEFGIMTIEGDDYSSILCFVGTSQGRLATFKILPSPNGTYSVSFAGVSSLEDRILHIHPMDTHTGEPAHASQSAMSGLRTGTRIDGVLVTVTFSGVRVFQPPSSKGAHKSFDQFLCDSAAVARLEDRGYCLLGLFGDGYARGYSIPALKEIGHVKLNEYLDIRRFSEAIITPTGDIFGWTGPSEMTLLNVWGTGQKLSFTGDRLLTEQALIPPRPTISNLQWIAGTQYITPSDMDVLIGGPDRPPSKRMLEEMRAQESAARQAGRQPPANQRGQGQEEGYWAYMQRQVQERTERLGIMGDNMENLADQSSSWADDVDKYVQKQKRQAVLGGILVLGSETRPEETRQDKTRDFHPVTKVKKGKESRKNLIESANCPSEAHPTIWEISILEKMAPRKRNNGRKKSVAKTAASSRPKRNTKPRKKSFSVHGERKGSRMPKETGPRAGNKGRGRRPTTLDKEKKDKEQVVEEVQSQTPKTVSARKSWAKRASTSTLGSDGIVVESIDDTRSHRSRHPSVRSGSSWPAQSPVSFRWGSPTISFPDDTSSEDEEDVEEIIVHEYEPDQMTSSSSIAFRPPRSWSTAQVHDLLHRGTWGCSYTASGNRGMEGRRPGVPRSVQEAVVMREARRVLEGEWGLRMDLEDGVWRGGMGEEVVVVDDDDEEAREDEGGERWRGRRAWGDVRKRKRMTTGAAAATRGSLKAGFGRSRAYLDGRRRLGNQRSLGIVRPGSFIAPDGRNEFGRYVGRL